MNFWCLNCGCEVKEEALGTNNRNHCPCCLWSQHLDLKLPGDRAANCSGSMKPIGVGFKASHKGYGELMITHECQVCGAVSNNRIAGDDSVEAIWKLANECGLGSDQLEEVKKQLWGKA